MIFSKALLVSAAAVCVVAVATANVPITLLKDAAAQDGAVCLDGSPAAYYHQPGTGDGANKWYVHHQGGGWCESIEDCAGRAKTGLGSSSSYPSSVSSLGGGYFSTDPSVNPMMYNWNMVFMRYCDGGSFSGDNETTTNYGSQTLYFRGHRILTGIISDLLANKGLDKATDLVVSGCSAGGLATYLHADHWAAKAPTTATVKALPDSGYFLDEQCPTGNCSFAPTAPGTADTTIPGNYHDGLQWVFNYMNATSGVNQACIAAHESTKDTYMCMFAEHTAPHIKTPTFPLQSEYDSWQTAHILGSTDASWINAFGKNLTARITKNLLSQPQHGVFLDSCHHHCGEWGDITIDGDNQATAFQKFYEGTKKIFIQGQVYPCDSCCKPGM